MMNNANVCKLIKHVKRGQSCSYFTLINIRLKQIKLSKWNKMWMMNVTMCTASFLVFTYLYLPNALFPITPPIIADI